MELAKTILKSWLQEAEGPQKTTHGKLAAMYEACSKQGIFTGALGQAVKALDKEAYRLYVDSTKAEYESIAKRHRFYEYLLSRSEGK